MVTVPTIRAESHVQLVTAWRGLVAAVAVIGLAAALLATSGLSGPAAAQDEHQVWVGL